MNRKKALLLYLIGTIGQIFVTCILVGLLRNNGMKVGLLKGDKYQSIALHENILFSYFEEPKTMVNIQGNDQPSKVIEEWLAQDPESHFIHMPEGNGENFMLLPALFAMGVEDL